MTPFQALILGAVQGITEFFPVSSSAHLLVLPRLLGWDSQPLYFDTSVHLATGLVILYFFRARWLTLLKEKDYQKIYWLILAAIPAGLVGFFAEGLIEKYLRLPVVVIFQLAFVSLLMLLANSQLGGTGTWSLKRLLYIGLSQILALVPGTSRSGITITMGILSGFSRRAAVEASFLVGLPVIMGAGIYEGVKNLTEITTNWEVVTLGFFSALLTGLLALHFLVKILDRYSLKPFVVYRILLAVGLIFLL